MIDSLFGILDPVMDPTREEVYDFLDGFFGELAGLFPDEYLHIGGDEVKPKQWSEMIPGTMLEPLKNLVDVLEEVKTYERMAMYNGELSTRTDLNRIVDAARPESYVAYRFNKDVDRWLETGDVNARTRIADHLKTWSEIHTHLIPAFGLSEIYFEDRPSALVPAEVDRLKEVQIHSENLSQLSKLALEMINDNSKNSNPKIDALISKARESHSGMIMAVTDGLEKILKDSKPVVK